MAHDEDDFYIAFSNGYAIRSIDDKRKIFFDTDWNRATGFRGREMITRWARTTP